VLRGVSLELGAGRSVAIVGPSGSGKSTLLNIMGALDHPTSGTVEIAGRSPAGMGDDALARLRNETVGFVFQRHLLLPPCSVLENALVPALATRREATAEQVARARSLLAQVGLGDRLDHRPAELSGGECQRVAVVRALANRPSVLLADEPTGSLDEATASDLMDLLARLNREEGVALVVVTHALHLARRMDRVLRLHEGRLEAAGGGAA
jgi:predicted ABC-type transport system involved in lysophospholipase L1 biosynthesis ATPase subunit